MNSGVLRPHRLSRAIDGGFGAQVRIQMVPSGDHVHGRAGAPDDHHVGHARAALQRLVDVVLQRDLAPAAQPLVGGDHQR